MIQIVEVHEPLLQRKKLARGRENDEEVKTVKPSKKTKPRHDRDGAHAAVDDAKTLYAKMLESSTMVQSYAGYSMDGIAPYNKAKKNQDSLVMLEDPATHTLIFCCLDGHGQYGDIISQYFKAGLESRLQRHRHFVTDIKRAVTETITTLEEELLENKSINTDLSGTTFVMAVLRDQRLISFNIGDSRLILAKRPPVTTPTTIASLPPCGFIASPVTVDHKPDLPKERARILKNGGRVFPIAYEDGDGPQRVWLGESNIPGLAMSRSLCDHIVHSVGVSSRPDITEYVLTDEDTMLIIATDGLWEFISNQEAVNIAAAAEDPQQAVNTLVCEAVKRWMATEENVDDTTVCVAFLRGKSEK